jgi:hypothetical protein
LDKGCLHAKALRRGLVFAEDFGTNCTYPLKSLMSEQEFLQTGRKTRLGDEYCKAKLQRQILSQQFDAAHLPLDICIQLYAPKAT